MSDPQRHVVPADIARGLFEDAFHGGDKSNAMTPTGSKWITWLVGPIACFQCNGTRKNISTPPGAGPFLVDCPDCDGLGYPPAIDILSEVRPRQDFEDGPCHLCKADDGYICHMDCRPIITFHGVVKLGKPVPISGCSWSKEHICTHGNLVIYHAALERPYSEQADTERIITDQIGPCSPGQVAYLIEVTS